MQCLWLKQSQAAEAIVVFGGWAVGPDVFDHLQGPQDILFVSDYRDLNADLPDLSNYTRVSLLAWSFGVVSYAHWQVGRTDPFARKVAVNGTLFPVDRDQGVPPVAMEKTITTLSPSAFQVFLTRVFNGTRPSAAELDVAARQDELRAIAARGAAADPVFDRIWISDRDRIFPSANQNRAWTGAVGVSHLDAPHAPFDHFKTWLEVLA